MTMLARWAETSAYTPPEEPTTGAVMSATDTAKEPGTERVKTIKSAGLAVQPSPDPLLRRERSGATPQPQAPSPPLSIPCCLAASSGLFRRSVWWDKPRVQVSRFTDGKPRFEGQAWLAPTGTNPKPSHLLQPHLVVLQSCPREQKVSHTGKQVQISLPSTQGSFPP